MNPEFVFLRRLAEQSKEINSAKNMALASLVWSITNTVGFILLLLLVIVRVA